MEMSPLKPVRFIANDDQTFGKTLRKRVNTYFKDNHKSKTGDYRIWIKVIAMLNLLQSNENKKTAYIE